MGNSIKVICCWWDPIRERFFGRTSALRDNAVVDCLIKWVQLAPAIDPIPVLNHPCLRGWTQLTYFLSFFTSSVCPLHFAMSRSFYFVQCPNRQGILEWPSYLLDYVVFPGSHTKSIADGLLELGVTRSRKVDLQKRNTQGRSATKPHPAILTHIHNGKYGAANVITIQLYQFTPLLFCCSKIQRNEARSCNGNYFLHCCVRKSSQHIFTDIPVFYTTQFLRPEHPFTYMELNWRERAFGLAQTATRLTKQSIILRSQGQIFSYVDNFIQLDRQLHLNPH